MQGKLSCKVIFMLAIIIISQLALLTYFGVNKTRMHVDELYTYGLSNSYDTEFLFDSLPCVKSDCSHNKWLDKSVFHDYLTVQSNEGFSYGTVFDNQVHDVHPPFYYFIFHTICSFFPDTFSKWFGLLLNFTLFVLCQSVLFALARTVSKSDKLSLLTCAFWGFGVGALNSVLFIRMYILLTLFMLLSMFLHLHLIQREKLSPKYLTSIMIVTTLGGLTQYYFYFFAVFLSICVCFNFLVNKEWKKFRTYAIGMLISVIIATLLFPAIFKHLTEFRGTAAINALSTLNSNGAMAKTLFSAIFNELFGFPINMATYAALSTSVIARLLWSIINSLSLLSATGCIIFLFKRRKSDVHEVFLDLKVRIVDIFTATNINIIKSINIVSKHRVIVLLAVVCGAYFFIITNVAPDMKEYTDRYIFCIYPFICLLVVSSLSAIMKRVTKISMLRTSVMLVLVTTAVLSSHFNNPGQYLFSDTETSISFRNDTINANCILLVPYDYLIQFTSDDFMQSNGVFIARPDDLEGIINAIDTLPAGGSNNLLIVSDPEYEHETLIRPIVKHIEEETGITPSFLYRCASGPDVYYVYRLS